MNVMRAVQVFSLQVIGALEHLRNLRGNSSIVLFKDAASTINFMKAIKRWFDIHNTTYSGNDCKLPISKQDDIRLLWVENELPGYIKRILDSSVAAGVGNFTDEAYAALLFTTKSTVETVRFLLRKGVNYVLTKKFNSDPIEALFGKLRAMCGGNGALDARAVTAAFTHIVKENALPSKDMGIRDENIEEAAVSIPEDVIEELQALREPPRKPPNSVAYVGGYIAKLITDVGCETCAMLVTTYKTSNPLYPLLRQQEAYNLHYPKSELLSMLDTIVTFFEKAVKYLPRTKILETLQLTVEPYLEDSPLLDCPEGVDKSHARVLIGFLAVTANFVATAPFGDVEPWQMLERSSLNSSGYRTEQRVIPTNLHPVIEGYMAKHRGTVPFPLYRGYKGGPPCLRQLGHDALRGLYSPHFMYQRVG
ncbi:hypothetical protein HPB52_005471 [Rhipicephalus sanguineus]|uniref:Transposable element P transposase-like GTP-binding insertion domain-containing protein n=1 Tax=Rhipicephalus sanguineus TaxID=34632 RepID=A0A9D4QHD8_RHISA|nr:hypothetical protein HPB52_005471 [Rhipicephalus sanguineus]